MTVERVCEGWSLAVCQPHRPILLGPGDICADVGDDGMLKVSGWRELHHAVNLPIAALQALLAAHEQWQRGEVK